MIIFGLAVRVILFNSFYILLSAWKICSGSEYDDAATSCIRKLMEKQLGENFLHFFFLLCFLSFFGFVSFRFFLLGELFAVSSYIQTVRHKDLRIGSFMVKTSIKKTVNIICLKKKQTLLLLVERRKTRKNINLKKILNSGLKTFQSSVSVTLLRNGTWPSLTDTYSLKGFLRDLHRKMPLEINDSVAGHLSIDYTY